MQPKGSIVVECGNALLKNGYKIRILNTINFKKSMHYNPFAYVHSEKDILKLVTTLMTNTKGEGSGGDPFWEKSERLLLTALIAYLHYETSVYKGYKQDKIEMRGDRAEMSDFPLYLNTVAGGLDRRDQTIGGFSFVVKIYAVPVVEIIG